jgi:tetratricopeptide (TPR) repeat protein
MILGLNPSIRAAVLGVGLSAAGGAFAQGKLAAPKPQGKATSIVVRSNVKQAGVMEDGLFVGYAGNPFDAEPGIHGLIVSAPGYIPRFTRVLLGSGTTTRTVNLQPVPDKNTDVELDFGPAGQYPAARYDIRTAQSLCAAFNAAGGTAAAGPKGEAPAMLACGRKTLVDDLKAFGDGVLFPPPQTTGPLANAYAARYGAETDAFYWSAEERFGAEPGSPLAAHLLAWSALLRKDCGRVMQVTLETSVVRKPTTGMTLLRAFCVEATGQGDKAAKLYEAVAAAPGAGCDALFQVARGTWATAPKVAEGALAKCTRLAPSYYPAYEALVHMYTLNKRLDLVKTTLAAWRNATAAVARTLMKQKPPNPAAVRDAWLRNPWSFELAAMTAAFGDAADAQKALDGIGATIVTDRPTIKALLPKLEARKDPRLTVVAYQTLVAELGGQASYWIRLADAYRKLGRCSESIAASEHGRDLLGPGDRRDAMLVSDTPCLMALDRHAAAEAMLLELTKSRPGWWKAHYNLAIVQERMGNLAAAVENYEIALGSGEMPETVRARLQTLLSHHRETLRVKAKAAGGESGLKGDEDGDR